MGKEDKTVLQSNFQNLNTKVNWTDKQMYNIYLIIRIALIASQKSVKEYKCKMNMCQYLIFLGLQLSKLPWLMMPLADTYTCIVENVKIILWNSLLSNGRTER